MIVRQSQSAVEYAAAQEWSCLRRLFFCAEFRAAIPRAHRGPLAAKGTSEWYPLVSGLPVRTSVSTRDRRPMGTAEGCVDAVEYTLSTLTRQEILTTPAKLEVEGNGPSFRENLVNFRRSSLSGQYADNACADGAVRS